MRAEVGLGALAARVLPQMEVHRYLWWSCARAPRPWNVRHPRERSILAEVLCME